MSGDNSLGNPERELALCRICGTGLAHERDVPCERKYLQCGRCEGMFIALADLPSKELERTQYELHENDPDDQNYRRFVAHLVEPLFPGAEGPDYGCGNGPAGAAMLAEAGFGISLYDPLFAADEAALERQYDFIFCCEVAEHSHDPADEFEKLQHLLRAGGVLAVMTSMEYSDINFDNWHYRRDPTHVTFYKPDTMLQIGTDRGWETVIPRRNVVLFKQRS